MMPLADEFNQSRPRILLTSGSVLDLSSPDPQAWTNEDLAERLSRTPRWAGSSRWARPLSVAQHSLLVLRIRQTEERPLRADLALYELLHDAEEGFLGFDPITPLKSWLGAEFQRLCADLKAAIAERYGLPVLMAQEHQTHKNVDRIAAASEALHVVGWTRSQIRNVLEIEADILQRDPLFDGSVAEEGYEPWEPWDPGYAAGRFLDALKLLQAQKSVLIANI